MHRRLSLDSHCSVSYQPDVEDIERFAENLQMEICRLQEESVAKQTELSTERLQQFRKNRRRIDYEQLNN